MTGWPGRPVIYEINTAAWLNELARADGRRVTLAGVAAADWDAVTPADVDAVWLIGVWERSPAGLALASADGELQRSFRDALPDLERAWSRSGYGPAATAASPCRSRPHA
jgi:hypothetical protein